jgi:putative DNA primase/helicase
LAPVEDAYIAHAVANAYHPVRDYLNGLTWDGQNRIGQLAGMFHGDNPVVTYQDGTRCPLENVYFHRWLIGTVAKVLEQAQNAMLVFTGKQGTGKSTMAHWLCPMELRDRHYIESSINTRDKDSYVRLMQMFLWEVGELDATTRKQDVAELKQFISERIVTVRRSYGRYDTRGPAMASLIGTVNSQEFLADETGNRRFYVIDVQDLDWAYQKLDANQIWAEAVARYRRGETWRLLPEETAIQTVHNRTYMGDSLMDGWIRRYLMITHDPAHQMTAADILDHLRYNEVRPSGTDRSIAMDISRAMAALGIEKKKAASGARYYIGVMAKP